MRGTDTEPQGTKRYFVTYTGIKMPFKLVNELQPHEIQNRNTYFCGFFDGDRLLGFDKYAYGEIEMSHRYSYHDNGKLSGTEITDIDGETTLLVFARKVVRRECLQSVQRQDRLPRRRRTLPHL